jgi:hypothetical protein
MSESLARTEEEVEQVADERGLIAFFCKDDELMVDEDTPLSPSLWTAVESALWKGGHHFLRDELVTTSVNGNRHRYYKLEAPLDPTERLLLQACLGSDPLREILSLLRLKEGSEAVTVLFETPHEAARVIRWREQHEPKQRRRISRALNDLG